MIRKPDLVGLLTADRLDLWAVRAAMGQVCLLRDAAAHEVVADAWLKVRFAGSVTRWEYQQAALLMLDALMTLSPAARGVVGGIIATGMMTAGLETDAEEDS